MGGRPVQTLNNALTGREKEYTPNVQLVTFGKVALTGCAFSRPKPLLLLAYLTLEGPQERRRLAALFWRGPGDLQKKLGQLSVVLAQFKRAGAGEVFPAEPGLDPLVSRAGCDALAFAQALSQGDPAGAAALYGGPFLGSLDRALGGLELSGELADWMLETRERFAQRVQEALLELSERALRAERLTDARACAERAYGLAGAPELEPRLLSRLQHVLSQTGSDLVRRTGGADPGLSKLPEGARRVFLALAAQDAPNLSVVRSALKLSLGELSEMHEALIDAGLVTPEAELLAPELARQHLDTRPRDALPLLLALARATPAGDAFGLYRRVYRHTQGFGGAGDFPRARAAYCKRAKALSDALEFAEAAALMAELHGVELALEADPDSESRFLEAYALERLGRYREAQESLKPLPTDAYTPNLTALSSALLWRRGKSDEARVAAEKALESGLDWLWARALAHSTLGGIAYAGERFLEAASSFKKAGSLFQACGDLNRWVGSLSNYATAYNTMAEVEERRGDDSSAVERFRGQAEEGYKTALEALDQLENNKVQRARILLNIGMLWEYRKNWDEAEKYYLEALPLAAGVKDLEARLQLNLGNAHFMRQQLLQAREHHQQAVSLAAQVEDLFIQGAAAANLANMDNDPDGMEVALELLEQSGNLEQFSLFEDDYEEILKIRLREALAHNDATKARRLFQKLGALYKKLRLPHKVDKMKDALGVLASTTNSDQRKAVLLALLRENNHHASPPN